MKRFSLLMVLAFIPAFSFAVDPDGCFQMYMPGSMYPVICVDGTGEEGIGGRGPCRPKFS